MIDKLFSKTGVALVAYLAWTPFAAAEWRSDFLRDVLLVNDCDRHSWEVLISFSTRKDQWTVAGWYEVSPGENTYLLRNGTRVRHRDNANFYVYAENLERTREIRGDMGTNYRGEHYKMKKVPRNFRGDTVEIWLGC